MRHPNRCENNRILAHLNFTSRYCSRPANYSPAACGTRITIHSSASALMTAFGPGARRRRRRGSIPWSSGHARPPATARSFSTAIRVRVKNSRVRSRRATAIYRGQTLRRSARRRGICISGGTCGHPCTATPRRHPARPCSAASRSGQCVTPHPSGPRSVGRSDAFSGRHESGGSREVRAKPPHPLRVLSSSPGGLLLRGPHRNRTRRFPPSGSSADVTRGYEPQMRTRIRGSGRG